MLAYFCQPHFHEVMSKMKISCTIFIDDDQTILTSTAVLLSMSFHVQGNKVKFQVMCHAIYSF